LERANSCLEGTCTWGNPTLARRLATDFDDVIEEDWVIKNRSGGPDEFGRDFRWERPIEKTPLSRFLETIGDLGSAIIDAFGEVKRAIGRGVEYVGQAAFGAALKAVPINPDEFFKGVDQLTELVASAANLLTDILFNPGRFLDNFLVGVGKGLKAFFDP